MPDINSTIAAGFDPRGLDKITMDTQERMDLLDTSLNTGPMPNVQPVQPFIPKDHTTEDFFYKNRNSVNLDKLIDSNDPEKINLAFNMTAANAASSRAVTQGWADRIYKNSPTMKKLADYSWNYNLSPEENEENARQIDKASHWGITNMAITAAKTIGKAAAQAVPKTLGMVARGSAAINYLFNKNDYKDMITAVLDNHYVREMENWDEEIKQNFLPSFKELNYDRLGFFDKLNHSQFWTDDMADTLAFQVAAYATGRFLGGFGGKALGNYLGKYGSLVNKGLEKLTGASNLGGITAWAVNTGNEAATEAGQSYNQIKEDLKGQINPKTGELFIPDEIQKRASDAAALVFKGNLGVLAFSNGLENRWIQRGLGKSAANKMINDITIDEAGKAAAKQFSNKALNWLSKNGIGKRAIYYTPEIIEGLLKEGYWEENAQTALTRIADQTYGKGYYDRISEDGRSQERIKLSGSPFMDFLTQYAKQTRDASTWLGGAGDYEISSAIGTGGLIAMGGTVLSNKVQPGRKWDPTTGQTRFKFFKSERQELENRRIRGIEEINNARENFLSLQDIYNADGSINSEKLALKGDKMLEISQKFDLSEDVTDPIVKDQLQKSIFADYALAHIKNGTFDQFAQRLGTEKTEEELAMFGFAKDTISDRGQYVDLANKLKGVYDQVSNTQRRSSKLTGEEFEYYNNLLNSRLYELGTRQIFNLDAIDQLSQKINDSYEGVFSDINEVDQLRRELQSLENQKDEDGTLKTQKDVLQSRLDQVEENIISHIDRFGEDLVNDIKSYENANAYNDRLLKEFQDYSHPLTGLDKFADELNSQLDPLEVEDTKEDVEIDPTLVTPDTTQEPESQNQETTTEKSQEESPIPEDTSTPDELPPADTNTSTPARNFNTIVREVGAINNLADLDSYNNNLSDEERTNSLDSEGNPVVEVRKAEIIQSGFEKAAYSPNSTKEDLDLAFNALPQEYKDFFRDEYESQRKKKKSAVKEPPVAEKGEFTSTRIPWESPMKTEMEFSSDTDNPLIETVNDIFDGRDNSYMLFQARVIPQLENEGFIYKIERDSPETNVKNIPEEMLTGAIIRVYKVDENGNETPATVADFDQSPEFRKLRKLPVIFSFDTKNFTTKKFSTRIKAFSDKKGVSLQEAEKTLRDLNELKNQARGAVIQDPTLKIPIVISSKTNGIEPIANKSSKVKDIIKDATIDSITVATDGRDKGFTMAHLSNGYIVKSFYPELKNSTIYSDLYNAFTSENKSFDQAKQKLDYLNQYIFSTSELYFEIDNSFKINLIKNGKKANNSFPDMRMTLRRALLSKSSIDKDGNSIPSSTYEQIIKDNLITNYKILIDSKGEQYFGNVNPYFIFNVNPNDIPSQGAILNDEDYAAHLQQSRQQNIDEEQSQLNRLNFNEFTSNTKNLPEEQRQVLKDRLKEKINSLSDDLVYLVHQTGEDGAARIFKEGFKLQGAAMESTFLVMSKEKMFEVLSNLIDGKTYHHGATGAFIYGIPKSLYGNQKQTAGNSFDALIEGGHDGSLNIPTKYNVGFFNNGILSTETENEVKAKYEAATPVIEITPIQSTPFVEKKGRYGRAPVKIGKKSNPQVKTVEKIKLDFSHNGTAYYFDKNIGSLRKGSGMPVINTTEEVLESLYKAYPFSKENMENTIFKATIPMGLLGNYVFYSGYSQVKGEYLMKNGLIAQESIEDLLNSKNLTPEAKKIINQIQGRYCK